MKLILILFIIIFVFCSCSFKVNLKPATVVFINNGTQPSAIIVKLAFRGENEKDFILDSQDRIQGNSMIQNETRSFQVASGTYTVIVKTYYSMVGYTDRMSSSNITVKGGDTLTIDRSLFPADINW